MSAAAAIHDYLKAVSPNVQRDDLMEAAVKLATAVNMFMGEANPLKPLTLDASAVNIIKAQAAGLEFAIGKHGIAEMHP
jgi:hypothetical protein